MNTTLRALIAACSRTSIVTAVPKARIGQGEANTFDLGDIFPFGAGHLRLHCDNSAVVPRSGRSWSTG